MITNSDLLHQWRNVLRSNVGGLLVLFDGDGNEALCQIEALSFQHARLLVLERRRNRALPKKILHLFPALIKKDRFEWILEKGTELGVMYFHPIICDRSGRMNFNLERAKKIVREASEQSGRGVLPDVLPPANLKDTLKLIAENGLEPAALEIGGEKRLTGISSSGPFAILVGPEGGWSARELAMLEKSAVPLVSLGKATLRAETAAITAAAMLLV